MDDYRFIDTDNLINVQYMGLTTRGVPGSWCFPQGNATNVWFTTMPWTILFVLQLHDLISEFVSGVGASWTPAPPEVPQYFQIILFWKYVIRSVTTRGNPDRDEWVTEYELLYRLNDFSFWEYYRNPDNSVVVCIVMLLSE